MKGKVLLAVVCLAVGAIGALLLVPSGLPVSQAACQQGGCPPTSPNCPGACGNGDVNGNGDIDIADAVYILSHLFAKGPPPVAFEYPACDSCCPPSSASILRGTGQTKCYDAAGAEIDCASTEYPGQDGFYRDGCPIAGRFVDNGNGTVTDKCTGLMWLKGMAHCTWQQALQYCENLDFGGYTDWRLPNVRELQSVVNYGQHMPAIDRIFGEVPPERFWSSSSCIDFPLRAFVVDFELGCISDVGKLEICYACAVRSLP